MKRWRMDAAEHQTVAGTLTIRTWLTGKRFLASISISLDDDPDPSPCGYDDSQKPGYDWRRAEYAQ